ncbi:hypothetical protein [Rouxiella sp. Mn2063]|uniref:hypothetical protein n=1 Tax=Rouxiella sp. Mn2063 TaxID=3395262 RepID=UPI003BEC8972
MTSLVKTKGRTVTGVHFLQQSGHSFKYRVCMDSIKRKLSVEVKPEHHHLFRARADGVHHSQKFSTIDEGSQHLIEFLYKMTGVRCTI